MRPVHHSGSPASHVRDSRRRIARIRCVRFRRSVRASLVGTSLVLIAAQPLTAAAPSRARAASRFQTTRTFKLSAGRAERTFTFRERGGVILLNRLTVPHGVRAIVDARIPHLAGVRVASWPSRNDPSLTCRQHGRFDVCTQSEEWCPMPQAIWHFRLAKLNGPAGPIRFDYVVAAPPADA